MGRSRRSVSLRTSGSFARLALVRGEESRGGGRQLGAAWPDPGSGTSGEGAARWGGRRPAAGLGAVGAGGRAERPSGSRGSAECGRRPANGGVRRQLGAPGQAPDSSQELGAERGGLRRQPPPPHNDLNQLFRRNINGTPIRLLTFC